jgi:hypothetical protein
MYKKKKKQTNKTKTKKPQKIYEQKNPQTKQIEYM